MTRTARSWEADQAAARRLMQERFLWDRGWSYNPLQGDAAWLDPETTDSWHTFADALNIAFQRGTTSEDA